MNAPDRVLYCISDLHLGGAPGPGGERGFRLFTAGDVLAGFLDELAALPADVDRELVINGDFVDFLAEACPEGGGSPWQPLRWQGGHALRDFDRIRRQEARVFAALASVARRHRVTILLGNHDLELSYPRVAAQLQATLSDGGPADVTLRFDGRGYRAGDALIEHGNADDPWNRLDYDQLAAFVSRPATDEAPAFDVPRGSLLVAELMNPIKERYGFVDMLKPETEAALPLIACLEPGHLAKVPRVLQLRAQAMATRGADIADGGGGSTEDPLAELLQRELGVSADALRAARVLAPTAGDIADAGALPSLLDLRPSDLAFEARLRLLGAALERWHRPALFDAGEEPNRGILRRLEHLEERSPQIATYCIGHTHLARDLVRPSGLRYLNSGTWAQLMRLPPDVVDGGRVVPGSLRRFVGHLRTNALDPLAELVPTYCRIAIDNQGRSAGQTLTYGDGPLW